MVILCVHRKNSTRSTVIKKHGFLCCSAELLWKLNLCRLSKAQMFIIIRRIMVQTHWRFLILRLRQRLLDISSRKCPRNVSVIHKFLLMRQKHLRRQRRVSHMKLAVIWERIVLLIMWQQSFFQMSIRSLLFQIRLRIVWMWKKWRS